MSVDGIEQDLLAHHSKLHDMVSDMIEGGRLSEADIPDDYQALVDHLVEGVRLDHELNNAKREAGEDTSC